MDPQTSTREILPNTNLMELGRNQHRRGWLIFEVVWEVGSPLATLTLHLMEKP